MQWVNCDNDISIGGVRIVLVLVSVLVLVLVLVEAAAAEMPRAILVQVLKQATPPASLLICHQANFESFLSIIIVTNRIVQ